jgi:hypothetical protein
MNAGIGYVDELRQAQIDIKTVGAQLPALSDARDRALIAWNRLLAHLAETHKQIVVAQQELEASHHRLEEAAARAYTQGASARVNAIVGSVFGANDVVQASSDLLMIDTYGSHEVDTAQAYQQEKQALAQKIQEIESKRVETRGLLDAAQGAFDDAQQRYHDAQKNVLDAKAGIVRFGQLAIDSGSPVLGPSFVSAADLAAFVVARGYKPNISVPIGQLAKYYIDEGNAAGVRGDVAFAQSILETDGFQFPGSGALVGKSDNNFAGIGACDSCTHAFMFKSAQLGVRAQMQLLRTYVDPEFGAATLAALTSAKPGKASPKSSSTTTTSTTLATGTTSTNATTATSGYPPYPFPILLPGTLKLGFRGQVQSWYDLGRHWATGANYGDHVYGIYMQIVAFAAARHHKP